MAKSNAVHVVALPKSLWREQVATNKRYAAAAAKGFTVSDCAKSVEADFGKIDIVVHSLANGPEVTKPLLETSRKAIPPCPPMSLLLSPLQHWVSAPCLDAGTFSIPLHDALNVR